jgi:hypothetical protein
MRHLLAGIALGLATGFAVLRAALVPAPTMPYGTDPHAADLTPRRRS